MSLEKTTIFFPQITIFFFQKNLLKELHDRDKEIMDEILERESKLFQTECASNNISQSATKL